MFGYVRANVAALTDEQTARYRAHYCGLCRTLGKRHGSTGQMTLTYDMTFLTIFLSSLYEPEEEQGTLRCAPHPVKAHPFVCSEITDYAADMTIALTYHKLLDDWKDDGSHTAKAGADLLKKHYQQVRERWSEQCRVIEESMAELSAIERRKDPSPDAAANCFGRLMSAIFIMKNDYWRGALHTFGMSLGRFVYLADAACDYDKDKKSGSYNPVVLMDKDPEDMRDALKLTLGGASEAFEALPLVQDADIMRNILYSGVWQTYNESMEKRKEGKA